VVLAALAIDPARAGELAMERKQVFERTTKRQATPPQEKETQLAIAMGGAVALGAFEAGILAELTSGLARYNAGPQRHRYVIDVLAGASAGSMSLAVLARELYDPSADVTAPDYPERSVFYKAWVKDIDVLRLIDDNRVLPAAKDPFVFDAQPIYDIANDALGASLRQGVAPESLTAATPPGACGNTALTLAPERLALGMTLSNMDGLTRSIHFEGGVYWQTFYDDRRMFLLANRGRDVSLLRDEGTPVGWNDVALTAIASGAFPFAFEPVCLRRRGVEYERLPREFSVAAEHRDFHYVDGGYFDNDPLHLAQKLARLMDAKSAPENPEIKSPEQKSGHRDLYELLRDRRFIYLAPQVPVMRPEDEDSLAAEKKIPTKPADHLMPYARRIVAMGLGNAGGQGFREYIREVDANHTAVGELLLEVHALAGETAQVEDLLRALDFMAEHEVRSGDVQLLSRFAAFAGSPVRNRSLQKARNLDLQIEQRVDLDFDWGNANTAATWLHRDANWQQQQLFLKLFEARQLLVTNNFVLITATNEQPVAGGAFAHFGGFFNRQLREFDFFLGRYYAQQTLMHDLGVAVADTIETADLDARRLPLRHIGSLASHFATLDERIAFRERAEKRLRGYVEHMPIPRLARPLAFSTGNRWLDTKVYHQPRGFLLRGFAGYDEFHSLSAGAALDPLNALSRLLGREAHKRYYDDTFRRNLKLRPQVFAAAEFGYWNPRRRHVLDWGGIFQLHWRLNEWFAPRPTLEVGRRAFVDGGGSGWYHSIGIELGALHVGWKTDRSPSFDRSRPRSMLRVGFSFRPATVWRSVTTL